MRSSLFSHRASIGPDACEGKHVLLLNLFLALSPHWYHGFHWLPLNCEIKVSSSIVVQLKLGKRLVWLFDVWTVVIQGLLQVAELEIVFVFLLKLEQKGWTHPILDSLPCKLHTAFTSYFSSSKEVDFWSNWRLVASTVNETRVCSNPASPNHFIICKPGCSVMNFSKMIIKYV